MLPKGWLSTDLHDFISIKHGFAFKSDFFEESGEFVLLTPGSFYEFGGFRHQGHKTKFYVGNIPAGYILSKNDLLLAMTEQAAGLLGSALLVPENNKYLHNQRLGLVKIKEKEKLCAEFLYLLYNSPLVRKKIAEQSTGTKVKHTSPDKLRSVVCLLPPLSEQRKIAEILSTWDKAIVTTEKLIAASQQQKKALMQQLLTGKKRFAGFSEEWEEVKLQDVCYINPKKPNEPENGLVSFIPMDAVSEEAKLIRTEIRAYSDVSKGFTSFKNKDILVAKITPCFENGKGAKVSNLINGIGFGSTEFHVLRAKANISSQFIYYISNTKEFRDRGAMSMQGSAGHKRVTTDYIQVYKFSLPASYPEQQKIAAVLTAADQEIDALQSKLAHLQQEKKALMQQLLTGKRRVVLEAETSH
jgi:type I restriction enzyme S subunit